MQQYRNDDNDINKPKVSLIWKKAGLLLSSIRQMVAAICTCMFELGVRSPYLFFHWRPGPHLTQCVIKPQFIVPAILHVNPLNVEVRCTNVTDDRQLDRQTTLRKKCVVVDGIACAKAILPNNLNRRHAKYEEIQHIQYIIINMI